MSALTRRLPGRGVVKSQTIRRGAGETALPYAMVAPLLVFIGALALYPTIKTAYAAFVHNDALDPPTHFAGFGNFQDVFNNSQVRDSLLNTGIYVIFGVVLSVALGAFFGLLLQRKFRGRGIVLALMVLPWALPGVVEGVIWSWIYDPTFGVLNSTLKTAGVINNYQLWIGTHQLETIFFISLVQVWQITPLAAILVLASLQSIPSELYEAADVDGANSWQSIKRITLPLIRPGLAIAVVEGLVMSLNIFDQVYVLNAGATTGSSLMSETYQITFGNLNFGDGYALSLLATVTTIVLSLLAVKVIYRKVEVLMGATASLTRGGRRVRTGGTRGRYRWLWRIGIGVLLLWSLFPVYWALNTSLQTNSQAQGSPPTWFPTHLVFSNYEAIFGVGPSSASTAGGVGRALLNSSIESLGATILTLVIAVVGAYAFARLRFRLRGFLFYIVLATLTLPVYATLIPIYEILTSTHLVNTYIGIIFVYTSGFLPLAMWIMYNMFQALPASIEEAAAIDGATTLQIFRRIVLPIVRPGMAAAAIITFLFGWGQFIFPLVLSSTNTTQPLTVALSALAGRHVVPYTMINAGAIVAIGVPALIVFFLNRFIVDGIVAGSVK